MFKGVSSIQMCIFLLVSTAMFKYSSTSCDIIDDGASDCKDDRQGYRTYYQELDCLRTKQIYGPITFHCTYSSLQEIFKTNLETNTKNYFYVSESSLNSLIPDERTWSRLQKLTLENTNISEIVSGFFNGFTELTLLSIPHNNITVLNYGVFSSLTNLVHLNLSYNSIYNIDSLAFAGLSKLTILDLHNNKIKSLPPQVLLRFSISAQLTYIDLSDNPVGIPDANDISSFGKLTVNISNTNITKIENFEMFKAIVINASFNNIKTLNLVGEITICNISHNGITLVGKHFISSSVSTLDLSFNSVYNISSNAFDKGTHLKYLYLNNNNLEDISIGTFKNQEQLEHLDLSNNKILYFEFGLFNNLRSLKYLNISYNPGKLDFQALLRLTQLETLDFENNQPENFDKFFFETHNDLRQIRLGYDAWDCGDLAKIIHLMEKRNITVLQGNNVDSTHIHGIECKSNFQHNTENNSDTTTTFYEGKENGSQNDIIALNNSIIPYFEDLKNPFLYNFAFNKSFENIRSYNVVKLDHVHLVSEENNVQDDNELYFINLNLIFCNVFLFLIICILLALILYLKKRNTVQSKEQVELL